MAGGKVTREEIFVQAAKQLRADFQETSLVPHRGERGGEAEDIVRRFLNGHIPKRFAVGAGFILDPKGEVSRQTDVVIYDAFNCPVYRTSETAAIYPSNNVAAVVEVKSALDKEQLIDAWDKIAAIKQLSKVKADPGPLRAQTMGFVFAFGSKISLPTLAEHYAQLFRERGFGHHIDAVVVLDLGFITLAVRLPGMPGWSLSVIEAIPDSAEGSHLAVSAGKFDEYTLDAFMRLLVAHLAMFRPIVDHPGFGFADMPMKEKTQMLTYLTSWTTEKDPAKKSAKLKAYSDEVMKEFAQTDPAFIDKWGK